MSRRGGESAGLLLYRWGKSGLEFLLAHPGGPFWRNREEGAWTIPKGLVESGEARLAAAVREFEEETGSSPAGPFIELGAVRQKGGKTVHAWACEGEFDPADLKSNMVGTEWPRGSGQWHRYPEIDRCGWFDATEARRLLNPAQVELVERLIVLLDEPGEGSPTSPPG